MFSHQTLFLLHYLYFLLFLIHKLIMFYYLVTWFFIILNTFFIFKVISILNYQNNLTPRRKFLLSAYHIIKWFSIAQIICIIPSTVRRMFDLLGQQPNYILTMLQTIFGSIEGVASFIKWYNQYYLV